MWATIHCTIKERSYMIKKIITILICLQIHAAHQPAVVVLPVADLLGEPLTKTSAISPETIPVCGAPQASNNCPRLHQLLCNEPVTIIGEKHEYYQIETPSSFFITAQCKKPQSTYWTLKKNIMPLSYITHAEKLPLEKNDVPLVTLAQAWTDPKSGVTYSAGTRFCAVDVTTPKKSHRTIYVFDPSTHLFNTSRVPASKLVQIDPHERKQALVSLTRTWIKELPGYIPYVWGGTSYIHRAACPFHENVAQPTRYYTINDFEHHAPKTGFDCSGLVLRAAQSVGISYPYKNTYTLAQLLTPVTHVNKLENGDLIWIPGHVMIVSDIQNNRMIEARSYKHGYGKLHEISLRQQFKDIATYADLITAYNTKKTIERLDNNGHIVEKIRDFKLLRLPA